MTTLPQVIRPRIRSGFNPGTLPRLDRDAPITAALAFVFVACGGVIQNLVDSKRQLYTATTGPTNYLRGRGYCWPTLAGVGAAWQISNYTPLTTSTGDGKGDFTIALLHEPSQDVGSGEVVFALGPASSNPEFKFGYNIDRNQGGSAGRAAWFAFNGSFGGAQTATSVVGSGRKFTTWAAWRKGSGAGSHKIYVDGQDATSASDTTVIQMVNPANNNLVCIGEDNFNGLVSASNPVIVVGWNRALTADEIVAFSDDPFHFLIWPDDELMASLVGAPPVTGSAVQTLQHLSQAATGASTVSGSAAQTLQHLSQAASSASTVSGTAAQALQHLTQAALGAGAVTGTAVQTLRHLAQAATSAATVTGSAAQTLQRLTQSAIAVTTVSGSAAQTLQHLTQAALGGGPVSADTTKMFLVMR